MSRLFIFSLILSTFLFSASHFTVRLAVYENEVKLHKKIDEMPPALKNTVRTYKRNNLIYAHSVPTTDQEVLKKLLPAYQKIFFDAYIAPIKIK